MVNGLGSSLEQFRKDLDSLSPDDSNELLWQMLRTARLPARMRSEKRRWRFHNYLVRRRAWQQLVGMGTKRFCKMCDPLSSGRLHAPDDHRKLLTGHKVPSKYLDADAFFNFLYHHVAEPLAD